MNRKLWAAGAAFVVLAAHPFGAAWAVGSHFEQGLELKKEGKFVPAAAEFEKTVIQDPGNADALEQLATIFGWMGEYDNSVITWRRALALRPDSADDKLGLARVLYWKGERTEALDLLSEVLKADPHQFDALMLRGDVLAASGRMSAAQESYRAAQKASPNDAGVAKKLQGTEGPTHWRLDAGYTGDKYTRQRTGEYEAFGQIGYQSELGPSAWVRNDYMKNFNQVDHMTQVGGAISASKYLLLLPSVGATPHPHFRPLQQADAAIEMLPAWYVAPLFDYRYFHYGNGNVRMFIPGVRVQPIPQAAFEYKYTVSHNVDHSKTLSYSARASFYLGDAWAPYISYAHGLEDIPPLTTALVTYYSAGLVWNAGRYWGLRLDYTYEHRINFYDHRSLGAALTLKY